MINNYQNFLIETVTMSLDMIIDVIKSLKGDENKQMVNKLVNYSDKNGKTVLMSIVLSNNQELIDYILTFNVDLQATDKTGKNVLFYCKNIKTFKKFYDLGVDAMAFDNKLEKNILLHLAGKNLFNYEIYEELITQGVRINQNDKYGNNLLVYSILNKRIVELLLKNNIDFSDTQMQDRMLNSLFYAFRYYKTKRKLVISIFEILFQNGIKFNNKNFGRYINDTEDWYSEKIDVVSTFIKPLQKYFNEDLLLLIFQNRTNMTSSEVSADFAKRLLNLGIYPKFYMFLKKYYRNTPKREMVKFLDEYSNKHPYIEDSEKYNL